jgi:hypothetical protein
VLGCRSLCSSKKLKVCANYVCIELVDLDRTLGEMALEGLMVNDNEIVQLTEQGASLARNGKACC